MAKNAEDRYQSAWGIKADLEWYAAPPYQISTEDALQMGGADAVYYGTQMQGVSNAKVKRELDFQPRSLEWLVGSAITYR